MKYKANAYIGLAWLSDLGTFDSFDEASEALENELEKQLDGLSDDEELNIIAESFWANSRIDEV